MVSRLDEGQHVALLPLSHPDALHLLASVEPARRDGRWWLVDRDGAALPGDGGGGIPLLIEIERTRPLGLALRALQASSMVDALDALVSRHRSRLGRLVPDGPAPKRWP